MAVSTLLERPTDRPLTQFAGALDPNNLGVAFISPRIRAHKTFDLLFEHLPKLPDYVTTEEVREWDYGDYEGLFKEEILAKQPGWSIWRDGYVSR
jgi:broad specificity phosphatase PhoE